MGEKRPKGMKLIRSLRKLGDRSQGMLCDLWAAGRVGQGENALLNLGRESYQAHDLRHPGPADVFAAGDLGLISDPARVKQRPPLEGLAEQLHHARYLGLLGQPGLAPARRGTGHDAVSRNPAGERADAARRERRVRPQRDLHGLVAVRRRVALRLGDVDDPENDLRLRPPRPPAVRRAARRRSSSSVTFGEIKGFSRKRVPVAVNGHVAGRACRVVAVTRCPQRVTTVPPRGRRSRFVAETFGVRSQPGRLRSNPARRRLKLSHSLVNIAR